MEGVSIDTRTLEAGDIFFAVKGETHDGHDHVARAFEAGAAAAVAMRGRAGALAAFGPLFAVDDTLRALERLAMASRARSKARIVAVTGSAGKTSAKEMLRTMLSACGAAHASAASYNNHWGVPLTLARMRANADFGIFEIGMNHAGEIAPLARMARPHAALVTTIAPVHIEHLGSLEAIADAKAEVFLGLEPGGTAALNRDAPLFGRLAKAAAARGARVATFGAGAECEARLLDVVATDGGSRVRARVLGREMRFDLGAPGVHMAENALGALLAAEALGADLEACAAALGRFSAQKGRGERYRDRGRRRARRPSSTNPTTPIRLRCVRRWRCSARRGPVRTGGGSRSSATCSSLAPTARRCTPQLAADLSANHVDLLFAAGPLARALFDAAPASMRAAWTERSSELTAEIASALRAGDVAMVKGSNGSRMGPVVAALRQHFARPGAGG